MSNTLDIVILGLSLSSSWGNGHAVTYRALIKAMAERGHRVLFLERDVPWYATQRDLTDPSYCRLEFYDTVAGLQNWAAEIEAADAVIVGSYVPDGSVVGDWVMQVARGPVAFYDIDTPVTLAALERGDIAYLTADQIARYDLYLSFTGGPTLARLEQEYGSPAARALYCSVDPAAYQPIIVPQRWDLSYLGTYSKDRQPALERLLLDAATQAPHRRFVVAGPLYPDDIGWPANVARLDHVSPADHPTFYSASRFTLNITRADMVAVGFSPSIRLFEAAACGAPIISDIWHGIDTILTPDTEIILARHTADILAALDMDEASRRRLADSARQRVLHSHTATHRAATLEHEVRLAIARCGPMRPDARPAVLAS